MSPRNTLVPALVLVAGLVACGDPSTAPLPATTPAPAADPRAAASAPGLDGEFLRLARQIPGFGGYYFDASGDLNVYLRDADEATTARAALAGVALSRPQRAVNGFTRPAGIVIRHSDYDFTQLNAWRDELRNQVFAIPGVQSLDADEVANRVRVEVTTGAAAGQVRALAARLGVPAGAVSVQTSAPVQLLSTLSDYTRPTEGGLQIGTSGCTLGLNVYFSNPYAGQSHAGGFFTASHCSTTNGVTDGSVETQGGVRIGYEAYDPAYFDNSQTTLCPTNRHCRWSDVSFFAYDAGVSWQLGRIARTTSYGLGLNQPGSTTIDAAAPQFTIIGGASPSVGTYLNKVGRTTGWTAGAVSATCIDVLQGIADHLILCQDQVDAYASGGDSGSPVFQWTYVGGNAYVSGIVWGRTTNGGFYFSNTSNISNDFGIGITWF